MGILIWIMFGLLVGLVAKWAMAGPDQLGLVGTMIVGAVSAVTGGFIGSFLVDASAMGLDVRSLLMAMIGSLSVLFCYRCFSMRAEA